MMTNIVEIASAKINLTLDVLGKRADGYHDVAMVMQSISLADRVVLSGAEHISMDCSDPSLPVDSKNLAYKAAELILAGTGLGVHIALEKLIPIEAGLAGGSSDAAAVLRGVNKLYNLNKSREELLALALQLGADVSFCLEGGTALAEGIGEKLTNLPSPPKLWLVLIKPSFGVSTASIYKALRVDKLRKHPDTQAMLSAIKSGNRQQVVANLSNVLEEVTLTFKPEISETKSELLRLGAENVLMSGSGPTVFGVFPSEEDALSAAEKISSKYKEVHATYTLGNEGEKK